MYTHVQFPIVHSLQSGHTPIFSASVNGHAAVVQLLIENGADISICQKVRIFMELGKLLLRI